VDGAANRALPAVVAKALGLPKGAVTLVAGEKGREKVVKLSGTTAARVHEVLGL